MVLITFSTNFGHASIHHASTSEYSFTLQFTMPGSISHFLYETANWHFVCFKLFCVKSQPEDSYKKESYKKWSITYALCADFLW